VSGEQAATGLVSEVTVTYTTGHRQYTMTVCLCQVDHNSPI